MHLSEGVLNPSVLLGGAVLAAIGVAVGLRGLDERRLSLTALFGAVFFVAGTIHIPVGLGSVHLILNGIAGLFLGYAVFPAFLIALILQVFLFSFGGFAVLGINLLILAVPALVTHALFSKCLWQNQTDKKYLSVLVGICCGIIGVGGSALLASVTLIVNGGKHADDLIGLLLITQFPVFVIDSLVSCGILLVFNKMQPQDFSSYKV